jgi:hypothetical protein
LLAVTLGILPFKRLGRRYDGRHEMKNHVLLLASQEEKKDGAHIKGMRSFALRCLAKTNASEVEHIRGEK